MPFDSAPATIAPAETAESLYRARREATAERWRTVPRERFNLESFGEEGEADDCGSTACALGWLAHWGHDGWRWLRGDLPTRDVTADDVPEDAAAYFGLSVSDARTCFGMGSGAEGMRLYGKRDFFVSAADVADALLRLPYVLPAEG